MRVLIVTVLLASTGVPAALAAQSLAAIAQREAARRKQTAPGKKYTNEELLPALAPGAVVDAGTPAATEQTAEGKKPSPDSPPAGSAAAGADTTATAERKPPPLSEAEWRAMARERRERIQRFRGDITALEGRLAQVEQSAGASAEARSERQALAEPLSNLRGELAKWEAEFGRFEERARAAKIPLEWIR